MLFETQGCANFEKKQQDQQVVAESDVPIDTGDEKEDEKGSIEEIKEVFTRIPEFAKKRQGKQDLAKAKSFMFEGDYNAAILYNKMVLNEFEKSLGDQALYQMGLTYVHPGNPKPDNRKSLDCFQRIIDEFPESNLRDEASIWVLVVQEIIKSDKRIDDLQQKKNIENNKRLGDLKLKNENLQHQIENLKNQIKKLKEIDLVIEDKKRVDLPEEKGEAQ